MFLYLIIYNKHYWNIFKTYNIINFMVFIFTSLLNSSLYYILLLLYYFIYLSLDTKIIINNIIYYYKTKIKVNLNQRGCYSTLGPYPPDPPLNLMFRMARLKFSTYVHL